MECRCLKCGYEWKSKVNAPKSCPDCKSRRWNGERKPAGESVVSLAQDAQQKDNERRNKEREGAEAYEVDPALQEQLDRPEDDPVDPMDDPGAQPF